MARGWSIISRGPLRPLVPEQDLFFLELTRSRGQRIISLDYHRNSFESSFWTKNPKVSFNWNHNNPKNPIHIDYKMKFSKNIKFPLKSLIYLILSFMTWFAFIFISVLNINNLLITKSSFYAIYLTKNI